ARHAADMTMCIYLLQMREYHRWERGLALGAAIDREAVGDWIAEREALWTTLEEAPFVPLPLGGAQACDAFDLEAIDARLRPLGLLYGAGLVGGGRPVFFIAELQDASQRSGLPVLTAGRELARGLLAPPAALGRYGDQRSILIRRESLARWCWERYEAYTLRRSAGTPFHAVVQSYGLDRDFAAALPRWLDDQTEILVLHELGEAQADPLLGPPWAEMRLSLRSRRTDLFVRAVRDNLADLSLTLPTLLARGADSSVHAWFANHEGVRDALQPSLKAGYEAWRRGDGGAALQRQCRLGAAHFAALAQQLLALHAGGGPAAGSAIQQLLNSPAAVCSA
ncbi:MAG: hypothetical protein Q7N95_08625, partial [Alphaproteobacteria bacterium]|nr:hypothetical protein [Alphaproteobacteria bacterium]